jgi:glycosyltransferase involved in cell wall biosynthesis
MATGSRKAEGTGEESRAGVRRLRVLLVMTARMVGGAEIYVAQLVRELATECAFTLAASDHPDLDPFMAELRPHVAAVVRYPFDHSRRLPAVTRDLVRLARQHDVVHVNSNHPGSRLGILMGFALPLSGRPVVTVEHGGTAIANIEVPRSIAWALPALFRFSRRGIARVVAVSRENRERLRSLYRLPAQKIELIYNGVDLEPFSHPAGPATLRQELGLHPEHRIILVLARLLPNKGYPQLIEAAPAILQRFPQAHFVFAGSPDGRAAIERQIADLGLVDRFSILGFRKDVVNLLQSSDVFVLPSLAEGFSLSIVEALAAGRPVVATRVGGAAEIIEEGRNGFLVPPGDVPALAEAIVAALSLSPEERAEFAAAARAAAAPFSSREVARKTLALYRSVQM